MHKPLPWADHDGERLPDPLDAGAVHFYATVDGAITGCGRLHLDSVPGDIGRHLNLTVFLENYDAPVAYISKLIVASEERRSVTTAHPMRRMYGHGRESASVLGQCHCHHA